MNKKNFKQNFVRSQKKERVEGAVLEALPSTFFKVRLENGSEILAYLSGKLRRFRIKILPGDRVIIEMSPYDKKRGRIVYRKK